MLRREFFAELEKQGFKVSPSTLDSAIRRGFVSKPVKAPDNWMDYGPKQLAEFIEYLKRTQRRRLHLASGSSQTSRKTAAR